MKTITGIELLSMPVRYFRTIVEHLVMLLEKQEFVDNSLSTGWLDLLIANKESAKKPDRMLALICGSIHVADQTIQANFQSFKSSLERGQTLPAAPFLKNSVNVDLIYEDFKYQVTATKTGPTLFQVSFKSIFMRFCTRLLYFRSNALI